MMPSKKQYDLVQNDDYDTRIPLHPEEAFHHGITFHAKYIGMLEVPRPTSRVEIVAAMRRIRYEFKAKGIKKKKVTIEISIDGVKVTLRKKKKRRHWLDDKNILMQQPIYRIFYVSHDSQDMKIFSYIARDGASNAFKCAVFKSNKKSQAMRIVRTVGQAFEVCHKLAINSPDHDSIGDHDDQDTVTQDLLSDRLSDITSDKHKKDLISECASDKISLPLDDCNSFKETYVESNNRINKRAPTSLQLDIIPPLTTATTTTLSMDYGNKKTPLTSTDTYPTSYSDSLNYSNLPPATLNGQGTTNNSTSSCSASGVLSAHHELQLLREQLDQQNQQTKAAMAQLQLAREQLAAEQTARLEAQARTHQLLVHNRELLDHIAALVDHLQGGDKSTGQQQTAPHMTMPQHSEYSEQKQQHQFFQNPDQPTPLDLPTLYQHLGLIENRAVTSPLRNSTSGIFNFHNIPPPQQQSMECNNAATNLETQLLLQRIQQSINQSYMSSFTQPTLPSYLTQTLLNQALLNSTIQNKGYATLPRSYGSSPTSNNPGLENVMYNSRNSEPRQMQNSNNVLVNSLQDQYGFSDNNLQVQNSLQLQRDRSVTPRPQRRASFNTATLQVQETNNSLRDKPEVTSRKDDLSSSPTTQFIKPLAQIGTLTTTDAEGRVRVIVPVPSSSSSTDDHNNMLANLRLSDDYRSFNGPGPITRSTSERVPNRSELMSQVHRTTWARHTTK